MRMRSKFEIRLDILRLLLMKNMKITELTQRSNLGICPLRKYINRFIEDGSVYKIGLFRNGGRVKFKYGITEAGKKAILHFYKGKDFLGEYGKEWKIFKDSEFSSYKNRGEFLFKNV